MLCLLLLAYGCLWGLADVAHAWIVFGEHNLPDDILELPAREQKPWLHPACTLLHGVPNILFLQSHNASLSVFSTHSGDVVVEFCISAAVGILQFHSRLVEAHPFRLTHVGVFDMYVGAERCSNITMSVPTIGLRPTVLEVRLSSWVRQTSEPALTHADVVSREVMLGLPLAAGEIIALPRHCFRLLTRLKKLNQDVRCVNSSTHRLWRDELQGRWQAFNWSVLNREMMLSPMLQPDLVSPQSIAWIRCGNHMPDYDIRSWKHWSRVLGAHGVSSIHYLGDSLTRELFTSLYFSTHALNVSLNVPDLRPASPWLRELQTMREGSESAINWCFISLDYASYFRSSVWNAYWTTPHAQIVLVTDLSVLHVIEKEADSVVQPHVEAFCQLLTEQLHRYPTVHVNLVLQTNAWVSSGATRQGYNNQRVRRLYEQAWDYLERYWIAEPRLFLSSFDVQTPSSVIYEASLLDGFHTFSVWTHHGYSFLTSAHAAQRLLQHVSNVAQIKRVRG